MSPRSRAIAARSQRWAWRRCSLTNPAALWRNAAPSRRVIADHSSVSSAGGMVAAGVHAGLLPARVERARRALPSPHREGAQRAAQQRRALPRVGVRVGEQAAVDHERGRDRHVAVPPEAVRSLWRRSSSSSASEV